MDVCSNQSQNDKRNLKRLNSCNEAKEVRRARARARVTSMKIWNMNEISLALEGK